ncbi:MAG: hypothetical protein RLZZ352_806 [Pseudomonadota bacterium]
MTLTCLDVNFGVWTVPSGDRGGSSTVTLTVSSPDSATATTTATLGGTTTGLARVGAAPVAGACKVDGAWNTLAITIANNTGKNFVASNHPVANGAAKLPVTANTGVVADLTLSTAAPSINASSEAYFWVTGVLTIPNNVVAANYGGYRAQTPATVTATQ